LFGFGSKQEKAQPLHGAAIEDYAVIGDLQTAALVSREGSIDWLCWPTFSSPACFASLLGTADNGFWKIFPQAKNVTSTRRYREHTTVLESTFTTEDGEVRLTDFMPPRGKFSDVIRIVEGVRGSVKMRMDLSIRFDYGLTIPWVTMHEQELTAIAGPNMVVLRAVCDRGGPAELHGAGLTTVSEFTIKEGDRVCFSMTYSSSTKDVPPVLVIDKELGDTEGFWCEWTGKSEYTGEYAEAVERSLMVLKSLSYAPTGGMVAAVTTSLPEDPGGERNWDYRYCWLRDTSFVLLVLLKAGYTEEAIAWRAWLLRAIAGAPDQVQTLYGIYGERELTEWDVKWLPGYEHSKPVRIGNAAADQFQLDVFGEVAVALSRMPDADDDERVPALDLQAKLIDHTCEVWDQPDEGIWEIRGPRQHFVYSKVMAWVALDRAIKQHEKYDGKGDVKRWRKNRAMLHKQICDKGFSKRLNSFTQSYGSDQLDSSLLRILFVGFLPLDDPRLRGTVAAVEKHLLKDGLLQRYNTKASPDGLKGSEGAFLACSFWLVSCYWLIGEPEKARALFDRLLALRNDLGLLSEEYDPVRKRMVGNFPQALSHIALIHSALTIGGHWRPEAYSGDA
jgi:GH15 family glucan-1,4-alpha-glucosidase